MSSVEDHAAPVHSHGGAGGHGHSHGLVDPSIVRSHEGVKAVSISLVVLLATTMIQAGVFLATNSVALLADLIHNFGDALTALPLGVAFFLRSARGENSAVRRSSLTATTHAPTGSSRSASSAARSSLRLAST